MIKTIIYLYIAGVGFAMGSLTYDLFKEFEALSNKKPTFKMYWYAFLMVLITMPKIYLKSWYAVIMMNNGDT